MSLALCWMAFPSREIMASTKHVYEVRPHKDNCGVDLISDALPFGRLWYGEPNVVSNAIECARFFTRSGGSGFATFADK